MNLTITDTEEMLKRYVIDGKSILIITRIVIAEPAEICLSEIEDEVQRCAVYNRGDWEIQDHPVLGDLMATDKTALASDIAQWLNEHGVSVTDMVIRAYEIGEDTV